MTMWICGYAVGALVWTLAVSVRAISTHKPHEPAWASAVAVLILGALWPLSLMVAVAMKVLR